MPVSFSITIPYRLVFSSSTILLDILSRFNRQSEETVPYLEPVARGQHQFPSKWNPCPRVLPHSFPIVAKKPSGYADRSQSVVAEDVAAETMIRCQRESHATRNVLFYPDRDADVYHASELIQEL